MNQAISFQCRENVLELPKPFTIASGQRSTLKLQMPFFAQSVIARCKMSCRRPMFYMHILFVYNIEHKL